MECKKDLEEFADRLWKIMMNKNKILDENKKSKVKSKNENILTLLSINELGRYIGEFM